MISSIINNNSSGIQIYMICTNDTGVALPNLDDLSFDAITFVGPVGSADISPVKCTKDSKYLLVCIWTEAADSGAPNSWVIYNTSDFTIVKSQFVGYATVTNDSVLTVKAANGVSGIGSTWWLYILIVILVIIVLVAIGGGIYYFYRRSETIPVSTASAFIL